LYVDGEVISTTGEHPFWVPDLGWVEAKDLTVGSLLQTGDGKVVDVDRVEKREGPFEVYNFNVEGIPTYFVSDLGILVHNTDCGLSERATAEIRSFENLKSNVVGDINSQPNHNHYDAARREARGEVVALRPDDTPFDHIRELEDTYRGLQRIREALENEMARLPNTLTNRGLDVLVGRNKEVQDELNRLKRFFIKDLNRQPPQ
ncbi:polymorphic toxin type 28 domain-containing protein, partial [Microcoleus sp. herbarium2]|uniref:polymorphic toxin type 28 domain-containing protein n=1 Tax=Microcoleus sp. herbarium2 TaxID=3055433 RepID=UPI002FCEF9A4